MPFSMKKLLIHLVIIFPLFGFTGFSSAKTDQPCPIQSESGFVFRTGQDVVIYLLGKTFVHDNVRITFRQEAIYANGRALTGAFEVLEFNATRAIVVAYSPYTGGRCRFLVDCSENAVMDLSDNTVYVLSSSY